MEPLLPLPRAPTTHVTHHQLWHQRIERFDWLLAIAIYLAAFLLLVLACAHDLSG